MSDRVDDFLPAPERLRGDNQVVTMSRPLDRTQRQAEIEHLVVAHGSVKAADLAEQFAVSVMTIHRDLDELERRGVLRKSRGGATAQPSGVFEASVSYRHNAALVEKQAVAARAAELVEPGMAIVLDDSTTVLQMIPHLREIAPLRIATNFLAAMKELVGLENVGLMALGGDYDPQHDAFVGLMCEDAISSIRVDATFLSTSAISGPYVFHQEPRVVSLKQAMLRIASKRYLLLDHTKFGRIALHKLGAVADFDVVLTDSRTPPEHLAALREHARAVEVVEVPDP